MVARDFRYFLALVELSHVGRAAELLGITQPALSKSLQRLEETLGTTLFVRSRSGVNLTPAGRVLADRARLIVRDIDVTMDDVRQLAGKTRGTIRIGATSTVRECILPSAISTLVADHPDIQVSVTSTWYTPLLTMLDAGEIDVSVTGLAAPLKNLQYMCQPLLNDRVGIVCRSDHPIFKQPINLRSLEQHKWALTSAQSPMRLWLEERMKLLKMPQPFVALESDSLSSICNVIVQGNLLGFLPHLIVFPLVKSGKLNWLPLEKLVWQRTLYSIIRSDRRTSHLIKLLSTYLKQSAKSVGGNQLFS